MTAPRRIVPGDTYLITRRCARREYLLRPDAETTAIFEYCLAEAAGRHRIGLLAWKAMSNHYHAVVHDPLGRLPAFLEHLHKMIAKVMNSRWDRWENFWSSDETCVTRLVTVDDIIEKVVYVLSNPIAADLVDRLHDWPGASSLGYFDGRRVVRPRPRRFFRSDGAMPVRAVLRVSLPPCIEKQESLASWETRLRARLAERERAIREQRVAQKRSVLGRKAVLRTPHDDAPESSTIRRGLRPALACKDPARRALELIELRRFRALYKDARVRWSAGERSALFPIGTYRLLALGARCTAPPSAA